MKFKVGDKVRLTKPYAWLDFNKTYEIEFCMEKTHTGPYIIQPHYTFRENHPHLIPESDLISLTELRMNKLNRINEIS